jgi:hypothetical protein
VGSGRLAAASTGVSDEEKTSSSNRLGSDAFARTFFVDFGKMD